MADLKKKQTILNSAKDELKKIDEEDISKASFEKALKYR